MRCSTRFWALGSASAAALGFAAYWYAHRIERAQVSLEHVLMAVDKSGLPPGGLTILHLSDFHFRAHDPVQDARLEKLRSLLASEPYDVLAFTGDLIHNEAGLPRALEFLRELHPAIAAFSVPGNRDYWESSFRAILGKPEERAGLTLAAWIRLIFGKASRVLRSLSGNERMGLRLHSNDIPAMNAALHAQGIEPLINCAIKLAGPDYNVWFAGIDDWTQGEPDLGAALAPVPSGAPLVLLAHNPDLWFDPPSGALSRRADLILSGHTHGGQLNFPLVGAWYRQGTRLDRHKAAGWFADGASRMFVSRGLGESFPFRIGSPPQAMLIRLVPGTTGSIQAE